MESIVWSHVLGNNRGDVPAAVGSLFVSGDTIYFSGDFSGTTNFYGQNYAVLGYADSFVVEYSLDGDFRDVWVLQGNGNDYVRGAAIWGNQLHIYGKTTSINMDFDPTDGVDEHSATSSSVSAGYITVHNRLFRILNVQPEYSLTTVENELIDPTSVPVKGSGKIRVKSKGRILVDIPASIDSDKNWASLEGDLNEALGISVVRNISSLPGVTSAHTLYVPIPGFASSDQVLLCPDAGYLSEVERNCSNGILFSHGQQFNVGMDQVTATKEQIDGMYYWKLDGVTGTGGMSLFSGFSIKDTLTRLQIGAASNHTIEFGTVNGLETSGDTIEITFDPETSAWDLSSILFSDIEMDVAGTPLTLAATPGADTWGVSINTTTDTITFTAPTSGTSYIAPSSAIQVRIGTNTISGINQITNPSTVAEYEIYIKNTYQAGDGGVETGEIEIPIIDDDTVNVHGYLDTFMHFDIDTAVADTDCDAFGAVDSTCESQSYCGGTHYNPELGWYTDDSDCAAATSCDYYYTNFPGDGEDASYCGATDGCDCWWSVSYCGGLQTSCNSHSGVVDGAGYVVSLGELSTTRVNRSNIMEVMHSDGNLGFINSIYLDLSTNANQGASITLQSLYGGLRKDGPNFIPSVELENGPYPIAAGSGLYGLRVESATVPDAESGEFVVMDRYMDTVEYGAATTTRTSFISTNSKPIDKGRVRIDLAASPSSTDATGTYTDELTFIATSMF
jgi:hypothetical protein